MKIREIWTIPLPYQGAQLDRDALAVRFGAEHATNVLVVEIMTEDGRLGRGECYVYSALASQSYRVLNRWDALR